MGAEADTKKVIGHCWWPKPMSLAHTVDCRVFMMRLDLVFQRLNIYAATHLGLPGLLIFILWFITLVL